MPEHPVRIVVTDELERSRLTVLFRLLLAIPHFVWLFLWAIASFFAAIAAWLAALATGRVPIALHRFLAAYVRYVDAPGRVHLRHRAEVPGLHRTGGLVRDRRRDRLPDPAAPLDDPFRLFLAIPAFILASALGGVAFVVAFLGWWYSLVTGRMPEGMRNLGASCLRYSAQTYAYLFLLTERYPYAAPVLTGRPTAPEALAEPAPGEPIPGDAF